jgi:hypothetical protein
VRIDSVEQPVVILLAKRTLGVDLEPLRNAVMMVQVVALGKVSHKGLVVDFVVTDDAVLVVHVIVFVLWLHSFHVLHFFLGNLFLVDGPRTSQVLVQYSEMDFGYIG